MIFREEIGDLFEVPESYALAHCISADFALGAGIAKEFDKRFNCRNDLYNNYRYSTIRIGSCAPTQHENRTILNLITKVHYYNKPMLGSLVFALSDMKKICTEFDIKKIAMPRIGCGLDKLKWKDVKTAILTVFDNTDIEIVVYTLPKNINDKGE